MRSEAGGGLDCFDLVFKVAALFDAVFVLNFSALLSFEFSHSDVCTTTAKLLLSSNQFLLQKISPNILPILKDQGNLHYKRFEYVLINPNLDK